MNEYDAAEAMKNNQQAVEGRGVLHNSNELVQLAYAILEQFRDNGLTIENEIGTTPSGAAKVVTTVKLKPNP